MWVYLATLYAILTALVHALGLWTAAHAVMNSRSSAAAIAWGISLVSLPWLTLPLYWIFGRDRFQGYVQALQAGILRRSDPVVDAFLKLMLGHRAVPEADREETQLVYERLARVPLTRGNQAELLIDGEQTFQSMFEGIDRAKSYVLVLFFILRGDKIGNELKKRLIAKARQGVRVHLVYDQLGSWLLKEPYIRELEEAGVEVTAFRTTRGKRNLFQLNFRNHRKIVIVDGREAWVGGLNVGDEYLGRNRFYGHWRDTHLRLEGPAVQGVQLVFQEDYYWATGRLLELDWDPVPAEGGNVDALYIGTGPADELDVGLLFFLNSINTAKRRLWLASPYFVPDPSVMDALKLAALRGVEVRIMVPARWDLYFMYLAAFSYLPECEANGIKVYRYKPGFMHQKVMLIDDDISWVGSSNADNRSMRLNFEGNGLMFSTEFAAEVEKMLLRDFQRSVQVGMEDYQRRTWLVKLGVKLIRLLSPIL